MFFDAEFWAGFLARISDTLGTHKTCYMFKILSRNDTNGELAAGVCLAEPMGRLRGGFAAHAQWMWRNIRYFTVALCRLGAAPTSCLGLRPSAGRGLRARG